MNESLVHVPLVFLQCAVKSVAVSDICLPVYSDSVPCEGKIVQVQ